MEEIKEIVNLSIILAESINTEKQNVITKLEARLSICPGQWQQQTRKFIEVIKRNIAERDELITKFRSLIHNYFYEDEAIVAELKILDKMDCTACNIYKAFMDEGIISE